MLPCAEFGHRAAEHGGAFCVQAPLALPVTGASSSSSSATQQWQTSPERSVQEGLPADLSAPPGLE
eukprot:4604938-Alexandrium_andersonii.AAC.1